LFKDADDLTEAEFRAKMFFSFAERLIAQGINIKNVSYIKQRLGNDALNYIQNDLKTGMVIYFADQPPFLFDSFSSILEL